VKVVDYNNIQAIDRRRPRPARGRRNLQGRPGRRQFYGPGYWKPDIEGATIYATYQLLQRDAKLLYMGGATWTCRREHGVAPQQGQFPYLRGDLHARKQAVHPRRNRASGYPVPDWFQQSIGWIDENGNGIRYLTIYHNGFPKRRSHDAVGRDRARDRAPAAATAVKPRNRADDQNTALDALGN